MNMNWIVSVERLKPRTDNCFYKTQYLVIIRPRYRRWKREIRVKVNKYPRKRITYNLLKGLIEDGHLTYVSDITPFTSGVELIGLSYCIDLPVPQNYTN